jgi:hypothetical protein
LASKIGNEGVNPHKGEFGWKKYSQNWDKINMLQIGDFKRKRNREDISNNILFQQAAMSKITMGLSGVDAPDGVPPRLYNKVAGMAGKGG